MNRTYTSSGASARLIRSATDEHLWAQAYDRDMRDVLMLQQEVARSIAREIRVTLTPEGERVLGGLVAALREERLRVQAAAQALMDHEEGKLHSSHA